MEEENEEVEEKLIAKKDHEIHHNDYHFIIKKGDDISNIPELFYQTLKTEQII